MCPPPPPASELAPPRPGPEALASERLAATWEGARDGLWDWDLTTGTLRVSPRWRSLLGLASGEFEARGESWFQRVHPRDLDGFKRAIENHLTGGSDVLETELRMRHADGSWRWLLCRGKRHGERPLLGGSITDVTAIKQRENEILAEAFHDALTGLPNKRLFEDRVMAALERRRRRSAPPIAVLYLDLDRFHTVNDSLGVGAGDQLLIEVTRRLTTILRLGDTLSRLGGDEFGLLLDGVSGADEAVRFARDLVGVLKKPLYLSGQEVFASGSLGIALSSDPTQRAEDLIRDAITAMHRVKLDGTTPFGLFDPEMSEHARDRLRLEADLHRAIKEQEFILHYQPIIEVQSGKLAAFEALVRWQHPKRGLIRPDHFVPIAEETGLVVPLGEWVLGEACRQMRSWHDRFPTGRGISVAVNLSARQLESDSLLDDVSNALAEAHLDPSGLDLEMTESSVMARTRENAVRLQELRDLGIKLLIDDFGTGYSSLAHLSSFPLDSLKVDRSFVMGMESEASKVEIVRIVLALARTLGMEVVAEGIETREALQMLRELECTHGQGYLFSSPLDGDSAAAWIEDQPRW